MHFSRYSIRTILGVIAGLIAILALASSLISGAIHQELIFDSHRSVLSAVIKIEVDSLLEKSKKTSEELGLTFQSDKQFKRALHDNNKLKLKSLLNNQFHQYFVTAGIIKLEQLALLDTRFKLIQASTEGNIPLAANGKMICHELIARGVRRQGAERFATLDGLCLYRKMPLHVVIIPVGGLRLKGYLMVVTDPVYTLSAIESSLGMPVRLELSDNHPVYISKNWPQKNKNIFLVDYVLKTSRGTPLLSVTTAQNIRDLNVSIIKVRSVALIASLLGLTLIIILGMWLLKRTILNPLHTLDQRLNLLYKDRKKMGLQLEVTGVREARDLTEGFNEMSLELGNMYKSLESMAYTDALTNLPNRNQFQESLLKYTQLYKNTDKNFVIFLMDLDRFKSVNDTLGHHVGDELLKEVGYRLHMVLRADDVVTRLDENIVKHLNDEIVARLGGDEFAAIFPSGCTIENSVKIARKLNRAFEEPFMINDHCLTVGLSIGIAMYPVHGEDMNSLVSHADIAMYHAKNRKCGFSIYESTQDNNTLKTLKLEQDLFAAIRKNELELHYQPKIDVQTQKVIGVEALVRWRHPEQGMIWPDEFIPLAEQTGLIQPLTEWVLNKALEGCAALQKENKDISVSVNLSALNLRDERMTKVVSFALDKWSVSPQHLVLELTESAIMTDPELALRVLNELDAMDVRLSIDDFGTGYSSLSYIKNLPVDEIKIDKSFVSDFIHDSDDEAIILAVLVLAHHMNLSVTAEGVEDKETFKALHDLGCDTVQGYHFAKPMPLIEYQKWFEYYVRTLGYNVLDIGKSK